MKHLMLTVLLSFVCLTGCTSIPEASTTSNPADATLNPIITFEEWEPIVPSASAQAMAIIPPRPGESRDLYGFLLQDQSKQYAAYIVTGPDYAGAVVLDEDNRLFLEQRHYDDGVEIIIPTGDSVRYTAAGDKVIATFTLMATTPPTVLTFEADEQGNTKQISAKPGTSKNIHYGKPITFDRTKAGVTSLDFDCNTIAGTAQKIIQKVCDVIFGFKIPVSKLCEAADKGISELTEILQDFGLDTETIERLQNGFQFVCKAVGIIQDGGKFLWGLSAPGWVCLLVELGENLSQFTTGDSLSDTICNFFTNPPDNTDCNCPLGVPCNANNQCCAVGEVVGSDGQCKPCFIVGCSNGLILNEDTCECDCPPGQDKLPTGGCTCEDGSQPDFFGNCCDIPADFPINLNAPCDCGDVNVTNFIDQPFDDENDSCMNCDEAASLAQELIQDINAKLDIVHQDCLILEACQNSASPLSCFPLLEPYIMNLQNLSISISNYATLLTHMYVANCTGLASFEAVASLLEQELSNLNTGVCDE